MGFKKYFYAGLQGFCLGAIVMAYIADYNREQLPIAVGCLVLAVLSNIYSED